MASGVTDYRSPFDRKNLIPTATFRTSFKYSAKEYLDYLSAPYKNIQHDITDFTQFTVDRSTQGRPEFIAYKFYKDVNLWWIICQYNSIIHPIRDIQAGMVLRIPNLAALNLFFDKVVKKNNQIGKKIII